jgi:ribosomal protein S18 acetylase RimI-like enzyme
MASPATLFRAPQVLDLRRVTSLSLGPVLEDQKQFWWTELGWDFTPSMTAIVSLVDQHDLAGFALRYEGLVVGYCYLILEDRKGIIGDLHLLQSHRTVDNENLLLEAALVELMRMPGVRRVEAQLLSLTMPFQRVYPRAEYNQNFQREVLEMDVPASWREIAVDNVGYEARILPWHERMLDDAGSLMARAYAGHIDSRINDQYRNAAVAKRFLQTIIEHPGCGTFASHASYVAYGNDSKRMEGMSLASLVGPGAGHITQICVSPEARGQRLGYRLLMSSLASLRRAGCGRASLSVTSSNREAIRLYSRVGFTRKRTFTAAIWEGF